MPSDSLAKYLFTDRSARVQTVTIDAAWREMQQGHDWPPAIARLLGELVSASALLSANLKFDGTLALQLQGDGDVRLIVVECRSDLSLRATVKLREDAQVPEDATLQSLLNADGQGRFIVVLDPRRKLPGSQPYQGVVGLEGDTVAAVLEHYMATSEQLQTRLWLAATTERATGLLLQRMPDTGGNLPAATSDAPQAEAPAPEETWNRAVHLAGTIKPDELLSVDNETLIHRLFWEEALTAYEPQPVRFHCPCSRDKVADMLRMLGANEVDGIIEERGQVEVRCDYCNTRYAFDKVDCAEIFAAGSPTQVRHQSSSTH